MQAFRLDFLAPIPLGHRVQVIRVQRWTTPLFGGPAQWEDTANPVVVDVDTGIVYSDTYLAKDLLPNPVAFQPNSGLQAAGVTDGRVTGCIVGSDGGDHTSLKTYLWVDVPTPAGAYR